MSERNYSVIPFFMKNNISIESTKQNFSNHGGLVYFEKLFDALDLNKKLKKILPTKKRNYGISQVDKFKALLYAFAIGSDCLADLDILKEDIFFRQLVRGGFSSNTAGIFLRSFSSGQIELLQNFLIDLSFKLKKMNFPENNKFILTMDSTPHEQYAQKREGMAWNYKNMWCQDSQNAYDQHGFSYCFDLRPGNTFSSNGAHLWIHKIFKKCPCGLEKYYRADSAYGNNAIYDALNVKNVKFTIVLRENIARYVRKLNQNTLEWKKTNLNFFQSDECELSSGIYPRKDAKTLRVVFIRAPKKIKEGEQLEFAKEKNNGGAFDKEGYRYYSIITNIDSSEMDNEAIVDFYRLRATAETYIKEQKNGYDFFHFPCQNLNANKVYGLIGTLTHNLMRMLSFTLDQKIINRKCKKTKKFKKVFQLGYFTKLLRSKINLACQVVCHSRKIKLRISSQAKEEMEKIMRNLLLRLGVPILN